MLKFFIKCLIISCLPFCLYFLIPIAQDQEEPIAKENDNSLPLETFVLDSDLIFLGIVAKQLDLGVLIDIDDVNKTITITEVKELVMYENCFEQHNCRMVDQNTDDPINIVRYVEIQKNYLLEIVERLNGIKLDCCENNQCEINKGIYLKQDLELLFEKMDHKIIYASMILGIKNKILANLFSLSNLMIINSLNDNIEHNLTTNIFAQSFDLILKKKDYEIIIN